MRQLDELRHRLPEGGGRWFRVGLVSTTAVAPLIARWVELRSNLRDLRAREEAQSRLEGLRTEVRSRASDLRARWAHGDGKRPQKSLLNGLVAVLPEREPSRDMRSANPRLGLWLAGACLGLVVAGAGAYIVVRRRLSTVGEEPLLELPPTRAGADGARPHQPPERRGTRPASPPDNRSAATVTTQPGSPGEIHAAPGGFGQAGGVEPGMPEAAPGEANGVAPEEAAFVGNMHTMVYHDARDVEHLPAEENRTYFASEEEALEAGYHRAHGGVSPASQAGMTTEGPPA